MTLTENYIKQVGDTARAYDNATDVQERAVLGARLDACRCTCGAEVAINGEATIRQDSSARKGEGILAAPSSPFRTAIRPLKKI